MRLRLRWLTHEQRAELRASAVARVRAGEPIGEVARDLDLVMETVRVWCRAVGVRTERRVTEALKAEVADRIRAGAKLRDIAGELGVSKSSVYKWGHEAGCMGPLVPQQASASQS